MEEDGCVTTSCMPVSRFDFPPLMHDPILSSSPPCPMLESTMDSTEVALMGNLLTDMLSSDFPYTSGSRYSVPDILQFPSEHSKMTLLQMLEESDTTSYSKLPVLEEHRDQTKLFSSEHLVEASPSVIKPEPGTPVPAVVSDPNVTVSSPRSSEENNIKAAAALANSQSSSGTEFTPSHQTKPKRKRIKSCKNSEEVESQRQTHIAVERNRRKQMNEHLNVLRSLMPGSYVQRGDQASIIGGAIEFVKELEQLLQCLQAQKRRRMYSEAFSPKPSPSVNSILQQPPCPFSNPYETVPSDIKYASPDGFYDPKEVVAEAKSDIADIEVKMVGNDAVVKILSQRRPGQLLKTISSLESMGLNIVHTNITTIEQTVLYTFTVRMGLESRLAVEEIAQAIQRAFNMIHTNTTAAV